MSPMPFLTLDEVLMVHADQIDRYGGSPGVRDLGLLQSAIAQPQSSFGGQLLHSTVFEMAAAYLFHLVSNHPFVDGNKRTALVISLLFLRLNSWKLSCSPDDLYETFMKLAEGSLSEEDLCSRFVEHTNQDM